MRPRDAPNGAMRTGGTVDAELYAFLVARYGDDCCDVSCASPAPVAPAPAPVPAPPRPGDMIALSGNTYPVKDALRMLGARWDGSHWLVPAERYGEAQAIVDGATPKRARPTGDGKCQRCGRACKPQFPTCFVCSGRASKYNAARAKSDDENV
jgi:hypothetical protein